MTTKTAATVTEIAAPVLTTLVPDGAQLGAPSFTLHVLGSGFTAGDEIIWNGSAEPTTYVSASELTTGVNMSTAEVAMPIPITVRTAAAVESNVLTFTLGAAPTLPELPDLPDGFALLSDAYNRPILIRTDEIAGIEDATEANDRRGALYGMQSQGAHPATAYRRVTFRSGLQFYVAARSLGPMLAGLGVSSTPPRRGK